MKRLDSASGVRRLRLTLSALSVPLPFDATIGNNLSSRDVICHARLYS